MRLFVYGSLKKGFFNHNRFGFGDAAKFVGEGTASGVSLVRLGDLPYPHAFVNEDGQVKGEVYDLDDERIANAIDAMEHGAGYHPHTVNVNGDDAVMCVADDWTVNARIKPALAGAKIMEEWKEVN